MATTVQSTALDFNNIKNNLKTYLAAKEEFADYNFETSGLSNILDVLAYNTHINALIANFAINESYLTTAQLRSSVISLAEGIGYIPRSSSASKATVSLSFTTTVSGRPTEVTLPAFTEFTTSVDNVSYTFQTIDTYTAIDDGTGFYQFKNAEGTTDIELYEGTYRKKTFLVGEYVDNPVYVIPDSTIDTSTVTVSVYPSATSSTRVIYQNITKATKIDASTAVYILKEAPNNYFELGFGDGVTFGLAPETGNRIEVEYLSTSGSAADNASVFDALPFQDGTIDTTIKVVTTAVSSGGGEVESIESIRKNAPFQYATQNRMVTAVDYASLIQRNFSNYISDIVSWGGEDNADPDFGAVYVSLVFNDNVSSSVIRTVKTAIRDLATQLSVISFRLRFADPIITYIETDTYFQYNPQQTSLSRNTLSNNISGIISSYFDEFTGGFNQSYRRSTVLSLIDDVDAAVLSSRQTVRMQRRFVPSTPNFINTVNSSAICDVSLLSDNDQATLISLFNKRRYNEIAALIYDNNSQVYSTKSYETIRTTIIGLNNNTSNVLRYPATLATPDDDTYTITSSSFNYNGTIATIKNKLSSNTLQIISENGSVLVDNIGSYSGDTVTINYFTPRSIVNNVSYIKLSALPANQSAISPARNFIIVQDEGSSTVNAVTTVAEN